MKSHPNDFMDDKRRKRVADMAEDDHVLVSRAFQRLYDGSKSRVLAMRLQCMECGWADKDIIGNCSATACPMWGWRPYQKKEARDE